MKIQAKITSYTTNKTCCKRHKSLIVVTIIDYVLVESYSAQCNDCGKTIQNYRNVKNLLITNNPLLTPFLLNKANQN
jgi:hypothetical protein